MLLMASCAKVVAPVGGPRDTTPPKVLKMQPVDQSVNFESSTIKITMDEFFTLNNPNDNVLISPPLEHTPKYEIKGKTLVIKIADTLRENTTYNMLFNSCIQDFNEGNKLRSLQYSFSTGGSIDSCTLSGTVLDAKSGTAQEDILVMLYEQDIDSLPMTSAPLYITKSVDGGRFTFRNIAPGQYKVFALKDGNVNQRYDLPSEAVAFLDTLVRVTPAPAKDSTGRYLDSTYRPLNLTLRTFVATDSIPKLQRYENPAPGIYKFPYTTSVHAFQAQVDLPYFQQFNTSRDTITWFFKSIPADTIPCLLSADGRLDTVVLKPFKAKSLGGRGSNKTVNNLRVKFANEGHRYSPLTLQFSYPIQPLDSFTYYVIAKNGKDVDTLSQVASVPDTFLTTLPLPFNWVEKTSYTVLIPDSTFLGYNGLYNDTLRTSFTSKTEKDYGNLIMNYELTDSVHTYLVQLWSNNNLIREDRITRKIQCIYEHLTPGSYTVKAIRDDNNNGLWDSGDYRKKRQPEEIRSFPKTITIRAFWDTDETFTL